MINIENFDNIEFSGITYGGHSGSKKGILLNNERWFLKYPKSTRSMEVIGLSYTTAPLSEYLGSNIYKLLGFETHETKLGISNEKIVVACKDFLNKNEVILDFNSIKNDYDKNIERELEKISSSNLSHHGTDLNEIKVIIDNNDFFNKITDLKIRFWDMFIVDAFINNNDRNDNNWGLILNQENMNLRVCPVYDNGASFYSKSSDERLDSILFDDIKKKQVIYDSSVSSFTKNGKIVNPLKYIESMSDEECNKALLRIFPKIDLKKIKEFFDSIPLTYDGLEVFSDEQRKFYYESLVYKYENVLKKTYYKLIKI